METLYLLSFVWLIAAAFVLLANRMNASSSLRSSADRSDNIEQQTRYREQDNRTTKLEEKYVDWFLNQPTS